MDLATYTKIKAFASRHLIGSLQGELEDCTQAIVVGVLEDPNRSWRYIVLDWLRSQGYGERGFVAMVPHAKATLFEIPEQEATDDGQDAQVFDTDELDALMLYLTGKYRAVMEMKRKGVKHADIAKEWNVTESRISLLYTHALRIMRHQLETTKLSNAENEVVKLVTTGLSNKEIAAKLFVCEKTVKFHLTNIYRKKGVQSRAQLIVQNNSATFTLQPGEEIMSDWQPMNQNPQSQMQVMPTSAARPLAIQKEDAQEQVTFVVNTFKINQTIDNLHRMSEEVTKGDYSVDKVMAACQCIGRLNETINTTIKAAQAIRGR